jgi:hypothetical protein
MGELIQSAHPERRQHPHLPPPSMMRPWRRTADSICAFVLFHSGGVAVKMSNVHKRTIAAPAARVGALLDTFASVDDKFRPHENWPRVKFNLRCRSGPRGDTAAADYGF